MEHPEQNCNWTRIQQELATRKMTYVIQYVARRIMNTENIIDVLLRRNPQGLLWDRDKCSKPMLWKTRVISGKPK